MYKDWFGLFVSDDELKREIAKVAKARLQDLGTQIGVKAPETSAKAAVESGTRHKYVTKALAPGQPSGPAQR
jgi:hypothetical protein